MQSSGCMAGMGNSGKGNPKRPVPQWGLGRQGPQEVGKEESYVWIMGVLVSYIREIALNPIHPGETLKVLQ